MAREPNLIRRPIVVRGSRLVAGYDEEALRRLAAEGGPPGRRRREHPED